MAKGLRKENGSQGAALCSSLLTTMRVRFKMDGGFVYLPARSEPTTIDTDELSEEEAKDLERLIEAAGFFELPETPSPPRGAGTIFGTPSRPQPLSTATRFT